MMIGSFMPAWASHRDDDWLNALANRCHKEKWVSQGPTSIRLIAILIWLNLSQAESVEVKFNYNNGSLLRMSVSSIRLFRDNDDGITWRLMGDEGDVIPLSKAETGYRMIEYRPSAQEGTLSVIGERMYRTYRMKRWYLR